MRLPYTKGHTTAYGYDAANERISVTRPDNTVMATGYDGDGNVISTTDALSRTTVYVYDPLNRLVRATDPLNRTTAYAYDRAGNRTGLTDPLGRTTVYTYDAADQVTTIQRPDGGLLSMRYDLDGQVITRTDALSHSTGYSYDALNRLVAVTDPLSRTTTYGYDLAGNRTSVTDPRGDTTAYGYDQADRLIALTRPDAGVWRVGYDANGNATTRTDPRHNTTTGTYDLLDRLVATTDPLSDTTRYQYDPAGNLAQKTDANKHATTYQYDALDRPITATDALSGTTVYGYDAVGNTVAITDARHNATRYGYDAGDEQTTITRTDGTTGTTGYDLAGNVITRTNGLGHATTYGYDLLDRPVTITDPLTGTTVYGYDLAGNTIAMTDPLTRTTVYTYDVADQRTGVGQADGSTLTTAYDAAGDPITATDALGRPTIYGYDSLNRVITTTDPLGRQTLSGYDLSGNRTSLTDAMGRVTTYGYDPLDRTSAITYSDGATPNVQYTYTPTGQRASMADGTGATTYQYDALDHPITVTNGAGASVGYGYDAVGNLTALTYPNGSQVTRSYDTLDRLSGVRDWLGHTARFGYDAADNLIIGTLPTSTSTNVAMGYDAADRLVGITDTTPLTSLVYAYTRDKAGEIVGANDPLDGKTHTYSYDKLAGLTADSRGAGAITSTVAWANDAAHEVTQRLDPSEPYTSTLTYDNAHELTATTTLSGTTPTKNVAYTYNQDGDRTTQTDSVSGASRGYGYDQADRLITATSGITSTTYAYDGDGLRQSKTVSGTTTAETWDTAAGLPTLLQDGATRYIAGPDGLPLEQVNADGSVQYYLHDQLGSTRALLDGAGHTVATYSYDAYGNPTGTTGSATTPFGYAGQYTDAETGLQYLRARYYDPATSQFVSADPLADVTGQPYAYTAADPLNGVDPAGLCTVDVPVFGRQHVPGTSDNPILCTEAAKLKARDGLLAASSGLARFNQSDLSNAVYGDVTGLARAGQGLYDQAAQCARGWGTALGCAQATAAFAAYVQAHPWEPAVLVAQAQVAQLAQYKRELDCHQYGAIAGHLLVAFALSKGTGVVGGAVRGAVGDATGLVGRDVGEATLRDAERAGARGDPVLCEGCFAAGTTVATPHGARAIQTLRVGDKVLSEDPTTHKVEAETVQRVIHDPASPLLAVDLSDGSTITTTLTHSFWVDAGARIAPGGAWLWAEHLRPGDQLRTADGRLVSVVRVRTGVGRADVWTLTVARDHTFFVGTAQVLVHNTNCPPGSNSGKPTQLPLPFDDLPPLAPKQMPYEWHHPYPKYLGGPDRQPLVSLPRAYHVDIHNELDKIFPRAAGTRAYTSVDRAAVWRALSKVYNKYCIGQEHNALICERW